MKNLFFIHSLWAMMLLLNPVTRAYSVPGHQMQSDTLYFTSLAIEGRHYLVSIVFLNEKSIEMKTELRDSSGVTLRSRVVKAKKYPIRENESSPVLFEADIFTAGYHCPVMIYIERLSRVQIYIDDAGCFAGEEYTPAFFGPMLREE